MRYYTPVYFFHITTWKGDSPNKPPQNSYKELRALAFVDTVNRPQLVDVLPAVRAAFSASRDPGQPFFAMLTKHGHIWLATGGFHARSAGDWKPHNVLYLFDDLYDQDRLPRVVRLDEIFDRCTSLFRMADGCPCPLAHGYHRDVEGVSNYFTYACGVEHVWPLARKGEYRGAVAETLRKASRIPDVLPAYAEDFQYLSRRWLLDAPFAHDTCTHEELVVPDMDDIANHRQQLSENAKVAAATRGFRKKECSGCVFKRCLPWNTRSCDGRKSLDDVRRHNGTATVTCPGFTDLQRNALMHSSANYRALDAYGFNSKRKRIVNLGYFTENGAFRVFSAARNKAIEWIDVTSWDALVAMIPQIAEWDLTQVNYTVSDEALRIYALVAAKPWRNFKSGWGNNTKDLLGVWVRNAYYAGQPQVVSCVYAGWGNRYEFMADGSTEKSLFGLLHDDRDGSVIPARIG